MSPGERERLERQKKTIRAIVRYIVANPEAKDTVEGVRRWWFPETVIPPGEPEVAAALEDLLSRGWFEVGRIPQGDTVFGAVHGKLSEMRRFLEGEEG